ncbi:protocadherin beta-15 isoform X2 [Octopus bimaculoides]|uniref:protocadherin beta-15 isoform X2 n=1 Tax=Octopus bimaculoides TaxID=37653 RepID=UPI00071E36BA|nr:protocadherin beta-15 isoform X2 [Octopus bimaculoides]|eukprot:XP_014767707.1 PREDICTED: protocadherin beta-15-like isoform X2 [Octopus bimaculoides]
MLMKIWFSFSFLHVSLCVDLIYHVKEERSPATYIGDIAADSQLLGSVLPGDSRLIAFSLLQRIGSQLFNVTKSGKLYTAQKLDAETLCTYNKECFKIVKAAVRKAKTFMRILKIKVIIEDANDHQPEFPGKSISIEFSENDRKGARKSIPNAIDRDVGILNSQIHYQLEKLHEEPFSLFVSKRADGISTLEIVLDQTLDREVKSNYHIQLIASDGGSPTQRSSLVVQISIKDENDNRPIFSQKIYNISIRNMPNIHLPVAVLSTTDLDQGQNNKVSYFFSPMTSDVVKSHFSLNKTTGEIFLQKNYNLDEKLTYKLYIEARDAGSPPLSSIATVLVNVINQHNNPPTIDIDFVSALSDDTATISEDIKVGSFIAYVMVTDNDVGHNGQVSCDIKHEKFKLLAMGSKEYKIVMKSQVDREAEDHYDITLSCEDKGSPSRKVQKRFFLQVMDVNDVQPHFISDSFKFLTFENEKDKFPVGYINATDPDLGSGGQLTYTLFGYNGDFLPFQITDSGFISTSMSLDREKQHIYEFKVLVKDKGRPSLNNTANITIEILDENDNAPYFTFPSVNPFSLDVHYHPQSNNDITVLKASDRDSRENAFLRYEILKGNNNRLFVINSYTGTLSFSRKVYQNDAGSYQLQFRVKDSGTPVLSASVTMSLTLTVSNKTSPSLTAVQIQSDSMIDVTWVIIIVVSAVIISVAIVISITLCVVRCNNGRNGSVRARGNPPYQSRTEMRQLIYQTTTTPSSMHPEEMLNRNNQSNRSRNQFQPEEGPQMEWKTSTIMRSLPKVSKMYHESMEIAPHSEQPEQNTENGSRYLTDTMPTQGDSSHCWTKGFTEQYEEIPGVLEFNSSHLTTSPVSQQKQLLHMDIKK